MKKNRHEAILSLISREDIGTQEELMQKLNELGYKVTQATVSRDIKSLKLIKTPVSSGQYKYSYVNSETEDFSGKYYSILSHSVTSVDYAGNMAVVKCYAGMANAACAAMDNLEIENIVGTLAGDDTIFVLCRNEESAQEFKNHIEKISKNSK
ncbi:MAG: arginine repressor [Ruminococcaceae bacterium]|nr:arginine repressor [Oscillospiraceae bacterium]